MRRAAGNGTARAFREQAGVTGAEIARRVGVTSAALSLWERGFRRPNAHHAMVWAEVLRELTR
jgi:transcriptional regulator with XRE-family HTH domain